MLVKLHAEDGHEAVEDGSCEFVNVAEIMENLINCVSLRDV